MQTLRISDNRRCLVTADGKPFFYLADTAWELFHQLDREDAGLYLQDRAGNDFNVIQAVVLAELEGLTRPNAYGQRPLEAMDPTRPNERYFEHVDWIVDKAAELGLYTAMLPTWGDKWNPAWAKDSRVIFRPESAFSYGRFIGQRYRDRPMVWVLGGDRPVETEAQRAVLDAMADGLRDGDGGRHLMTLHPSARTSSSDWVNDAPWLDFHMLQSGHGALFFPNWQLLRRDLQLEPQRPSLDGEPCYENHPVGFSRTNPHFADYHVRCAAYWSVLEGACGHTYGCHDIWPMATPQWRPLPTIGGDWYTSIHLPGARQVGYVRRLIESRPQLTRWGEWTASDDVAGTVQSNHVAVSRDGTPGKKDATFIMAYYPIALPWRRLDTSAIGAQRLRIWRFDPRSGRAARVEERDNDGSYDVPLQEQGPDWAWVVDDAAAGYPAPGSAALGR